MDRSPFTPYSRHHRLLRNAAPGPFVDHRNSVTTGRRREKLRLATRRQNNANRDKETKWVTASRYEGVSLRKSGIWRAQIRLDGRTINLGTHLLRSRCSNRLSDTLDAAHSRP